MEGLEVRFKVNLPKVEAAKVKKYLSFKCKLLKEGHKDGTHPPDCRKRIFEPFNVEFKDVFSWSATDMLGIHLSIIQHSLEVNLNGRLIKQKDDGSPRKS